MRRRQKELIKGYKYCSHCTQHIKESHYQVHSYTCREREKKLSFESTQKEQHISSKNKNQRSLLQKEINKSKSIQKNTPLEDIDSISSESKDEVLPQAENKLKVDLLETNKKTESQLSQSPANEVQEAEQMSLRNEQPPVINTHQNPVILEVQVLVVSQADLETNMSENGIPVGIIQDMIQLFPSSQDNLNDFYYRQHHQFLFQLQTLINDLQFLLQPSSGSNEQVLTQQQISRIRKQQYDSIQQTMCPICQCNFIKQQSTMVLGCNHIFHQTCLSLWLKVNSKCPTCRWNIKESVNGLQKADKDQQDSQEDNMNIFEIFRQSRTQ